MSDNAALDDILVNGYCRLFCIGTIATAICNLIWDFYTVPEFAYQPVGFAGTDELEVEQQYLFVQWKDFDVTQYLQLSTKARFYHQRQKSKHVTIFSTISFYPSSEVIYYIQYCAPVGTTFCCGFAKEFQSSMSPSGLTTPQSIGSDLCYFGYEIYAGYADCNSDKIRSIDVFGRDTDEYITRKIDENWIHHDAIYSSNCRDCLEFGHIVLSISQIQDVDSTINYNKTKYYLKTKLKVYMHPNDYRVKDYYDFRKDSIFPLDEQNQHALRLSVSIPYAACIQIQKKILGQVETEPFELILRNKNVFKFE